MLELQTSLSSLVTLLRVNKALKSMCLALMSLVKASLVQSRKQSDCTKTREVRYRSKKRVQVVMCYQVQSPRMKLQNFLMKPSIRQNSQRRRRKRNHLSKKRRVRKKLRRSKKRRLKRKQKRKQKRKLRKTKKRKQRNLPQMVTKRYMKMSSIRHVNSTWRTRTLSQLSIMPKCILRVLQMQQLFRPL